MLASSDPDASGSDASTPTPAVLYAAKSTEDRYASIPEQLEDARRMANERNWEVVGEFTDEGFSAYSADRGPGLRRATDRAVGAAEEYGTTAMLIAQAHDRFARGSGDAPGAPEHLSELWHRMRRLNVHLRTVEDDFELRDPQSVAAIGQRAHLDSKRKSMAVRKGMLRRARDRGLLAGGPRPYGYRWAGPSGQQRLQIIEAEANVIRRIYDNFEAGMSQRAIERALNAAGIGTARSKDWHQGTIAKVLRNELYKGYIRHAGASFEGQHDAIVPEEQWERVQAMLDARARTRGHTGGRWPKGPHLFTKGLLRCGICGSALIPTTKPTHTPGKLYEVYECFGRKRNGVSFCRQTPIRRAAIDEAMFGELQRVYLDLDTTRDRIVERIATDTAIVENMREAAETQVTRTTAQIARIERDYLDGELSAEQYQRLTARLEADADGAAAKLVRLRERHTALAETTPLVDAETELLRQLADLRATLLDGVAKAADINAMRALLHDLFVRVLYQRKDELPPWLTIEPYSEYAVTLRDTTDPGDTTDVGEAVLVPLTRIGLGPYERLPLPPIAKTDAIGLHT